MKETELPNLIERIFLLYEAGLCTAPSTLPLIHRDLLSLPINLTVSFNLTYLRLPRVKPL
jgi:hypothetical protein